MPVVTIRGKEIGVVWRAGEEGDKAQLPVFCEGQEGVCWWWPDGRGLVVEVATKHIGLVLQEARQQRPHKLGSLQLASADMLDLE